MSVVGNRTDEYGDVLIIKADVPIVGIITLTDFIDDTTGTSPNRNWFKEFRYANDGINFTDWQELTVDNINNVEVESRDNFIIEYRYTHIVPDESDSFSVSFSTDALFWNSTQVDGQWEKIGCGETYNQSIFADFFSCHATEVLAWCVNVTEKLYKQGIVPKFIKRGDESNLNRIDRDYLDFWRTVACFFAYIVVFARQFENFRSNNLMLNEFLRQRGIYFCDSATNIEKNFLVENYFDEIRQRGTKQIYKKKGNDKEIDGELLRLLCYEEEIDEFIFNVHMPHTIGWSLDNHSPLYKGLPKQLGAVKGYEVTDDVVDLSKYPLFGNASFSIVTDGSKEVLSIDDTPLGEIAGIGLENFNYVLIIDDDLSYEITFYVRQVDAGENLTFGVNAFDIAFNAINTEKITGGNSGFFFERIQLNKTDKYYFVRGIIYGKDVNASEVDQSLAIGTGNHLKFADGTYSIIPYVAVDKSGADISQSISEFTGWILLSSNIVTDGDNGTFEEEKEVYQLLNANIVTDGDSGTFEDVEANWSAPKDDSVHLVERSATYAFDGSFSCRAYSFFSSTANISIIDSFNKESTALNLSYNAISITNGRKYILKARIRTETNAWPNRGGNTISFNFFTGGSYPITDVVRTYKTHSDIENSWQEISLEFMATANSSEHFPIKGFWNSANNQNVLENGEIYIDSLVMEEYELVNNWGNIIQPSIYTLERSGLFSFEGIYSCRSYDIDNTPQVATTYSVFGLNVDYSQLVLGDFRVDIVNGRRYILKAQLRTNGDTWPNRAGKTLNFVLGQISITQPGGTLITKTNFDIDGQWAEISYEFTASSTNNSAIFGIFAMWEGDSTAYAQDGEIFIDQVQMQEYEFVEGTEESDTVQVGNEVRIWDFKIRPLSTNYSTGFVLPKNFISIWAKNRNGEISNKQLEFRLRKFLLPYNCNFKVNHLQVEPGESVGSWSAADFNDDFEI